MQEALEFLREYNFHLPKFAYWSLKEWKNKGEEIREIIDNQLGWDISDYGSGDFSKIGLIHFTIRNGDIKKRDKDYCEKIMIMDEGQQGIMHFHFQKMEDVINRGGGILLIKLYNSTEGDHLSETPVIGSIDGVKETIDAGTILSLDRGDSITLPPKVFHKFWVKDGFGKVLIGEVSSVNDDIKDNFYLDKVGRFSEIEEDEEPLYLLGSDYDKFLNFT